MNVRFIPADAGNTAIQEAKDIQQAVHPRGCGEYPPLTWPLPSTDGSSPRMRGILYRSPCCESDWRFIPADAGNTRERPALLLIRSVHPRGCGEYFTPGCQDPRENGSSPRMRGIRQHRCALPHRTRFIPADAGNTPLQECRLGDGSVHPRGCGEYASLSVGSAPRSGSSPRMRGIR